MDATIFKKILDRRLTLQAELLEIDAFLRQAEVLAARLFLPQGEAPKNQGTADQAQTGESLRDNPAFSFSPLPGRLRAD